MANNENKASKPAETATDNRVELFVPKGYANDDPNDFVGVNGVNFLIPRGKTSTVPPFVKAEFDRSKRAEAKQDENIDQMLEASK